MCVCVCVRERWWKINQTVITFFYLESDRWLKAFAVSSILWSKKQNCQNLRTIFVILSVRMDFFFNFKLFILFLSNELTVSLTHKHHCALSALYLRCPAKIYGCIMAKKMVPLYFYCHVPHSLLKSFNLVSQQGSGSWVHNNHRNSVLEVSLPVRIVVSRSVEQ